MNSSLSHDQLAKEGNTAYLRKEYQAAAQAFQAAAAGFEIQGDLLSAAEMLNNSSVAWLQSGDGAAALAAVEGTETIFSQAGDTRRLAIAIGNRAAALESLRRNEEAVEAYEQAVELFKEVGEIELSASTLQSLASLQLRMGRQLEAIASMQAGLAKVQRPTTRNRLASKLLRTSLSFLGR